MREHKEAKIQDPIRHRHIDFVGSCLLWVYIISGLLGKSCLPERLYGGWRGHMVASVLIIGGLVLFCMIRRPLRPRIHHAPLRVRVCLALLMMFLVWGLVVSALQKHPLENLVFFIVFGSMISVSVLLNLNFAAIRKPMQFLSRIVVVLSACFVISLVGACLGLPVFERGRLSGCFYNPSIPSGLASLNCLLLTWFLLRSGEHRKKSLVLLIISLTVFLLTRSRGHLMSTAVGIVVLFAFDQRNSGIRRSRALCGLLGVILLGAVVWTLILPAEHKHDVGVFFRFADSEARDTLHLRYEAYWSLGLRDLIRANPIGEGPLARFGGGGGGFEESHYDLSSNRHSQYLSVAQSYGLPGFILWIGFMVSASYTAAKRADNLRSLGMGFFAYLVLMSATSNLLLSFGTPVDRIRWLLIGIILIVPLKSANSCPATTNAKTVCRPGRHRVNAGCLHRGTSEILVSSVRAPKS